jgi:hypothetical protein
MLMIEPPPESRIAGNGVLDPKKGSLEVDAHEPVPILYGGAGCGRRDAYPCVVDHHVQAAPLLDHTPHERLDLAGLRHVSPTDQGLVTYLTGYLLGGLLVEIGECYPGTFAGEPEGYGPPDPGPCARDYGPLVSETLHRSPLDRVAPQQSARDPLHCVA